VLLVDPQMTAAQVFVLQQMGNLTEPSLTQTLIELLSRRHVPPELAELARGLLAKRKTGAEYMIAALKRPYDFLSGVETLPPVGPLATALAGMNQPEAAPLLATHLNDPSYDPESVNQMAQALHTLAMRDQSPELLRFFALNHATADSQALADAVNAVADTLLAFGGSDERDVIEAAAHSSMTHPAVKTHLEQALAQYGESTAGAGAVLPPPAAKSSAAAGTPPVPTPAKAKAGTTAPVDSK
jgi:hypothetical protein